MEINRHWIYSWDLHLVWILLVWWVRKIYLHPKICFFCDPGALLVLGQKDRSVYWMWDIFLESSLWGNYCRKASLIGSLHHCDRRWLFICIAEDHHWFHKLKISRLLWVKQRRLWVFLDGLYFKKRFRVHFSNSYLLTILVISA